MPSPTSRSNSTSANESGRRHDDAEAAKAGLPLVQFYDMQADPGEKCNLHVERGARRENDVPVDIRKLETMPGVDSSALDDF